LSPRSQELLEQARDALRAAHVLLANDLPARAVSDAYYAVLYAARAALSERDSCAKTHSGTWGLFHQTFVARGRFDKDLYAAAHAAQESRENVDYGAVAVSREECEGIVETAQRFIAAIEAMLGGTDR
jgi:uncharacterized protein (UPF0332 family)